MKQHLRSLVRTIWTATAVAGVALAVRADLRSAPQTPPAPAQDAGAAAGRGGGRGVLAAPQADFSPRPPVKALTPEEEAKKFWLPAGFRMEPVLADPTIEEPGQIAFDGNGRMYVVGVAQLHAGR